MSQEMTTFMRFRSWPLPRLERDLLCDDDDDHGGVWRLKAHSNQSRSGVTITHGLLEGQRKNCLARERQLELESVVASLAQWNDEASIQEIGRAGGSIGEDLRPRPGFLLWNLPRCRSRGQLSIAHRCGNCVLILSRSQLNIFAPWLRLDSQTYEQKLGEWKSLVSAHGAQKR